MGRPANASRYHGKAPDELDWTEKQRQKRAVVEYLAALEAEAAAEEDAPDNGADGRPESKRHRRYERQPPKVISLSDPQSAWTAKANKRVQFGYGLNYLIDIENAVIVDVEATPARTYDEVCGHQRRYIMRATSLPMTAARSRRGATLGSRRRMPTGSASPLLAATAIASPCAARSTRPQTIVVSTSLLSTAAASSRSRISLVPARVPAGN
jgi:hypothetical protein